MNEQLSRRNFLKGCCAMAGVVVLGSFGCSGISRRSATNELGKKTDQRGHPLTPRYLELERSGELARREKALWELYSPCYLCPRDCGANRANGEGGACTAASNFRVASYGPAFNIDPPISGSRGSGSIFMSNCNLLCVFCQNWHIAHRGDGRITSHRELANIMLEQQRRRAHNVNIVTPTHHYPHIVTALRMAIQRGLNIPLVVNSSGYESLEVIKLLDGVIDIYMPDFKFMDSEIAKPFIEYAPNYAEHTAVAIKEMHRQTGDLVMVDGIGKRGTMVIHLVMPENLSGTDKFVRWVVDELGPDTYVNIMGQFRPAFRSHEFPPLDRRITQQEFAQAMRWAREAGLRNLRR